MLENATKQATDARIPGVAIGAMAAEVLEEHQSGIKMLGHLLEALE
jgi:hypothetical protein